MLKALKRLAAACGIGSRDAVQARIDYPLEIEEKLNRVHARAPVRAHLDVLYGGLRIGGESFVDLYSRCLARTGTLVTPFNTFQRFQTRHDLVRYFLATLALPGARVECGAYRGATALLLCHAWRSREPGFRGKGLHLMDSFTGTSASTAPDFIPVRDSASGARMQPFFPPGVSDVTPELVRSHFTEFPEVAIHAGWVPEVFELAGADRYAFVHVDLTLYEPTLAALDYFYPRLSAGGVIFCDGSIFCPGVTQAVERYCALHDVPYAALGHRHYLITAPAANGNPGS